MKKHFSLKRLLIMSLMLVTTMLVPICAWAQEYPETHKIRYTASYRLSDYDEGNGTPCGMVVSHEFSDDGIGCITFSNPVTSIGGESFYHCEDLTSIILPEGLTSIGYGAFHYCENLTSIILPEGLTSIGYETFSECRSLTSITLPEGLTSIGEEAFQGCDNLVYCNILSSQIENVGDNAIPGDTYLIVPADRKDDYQDLFWNNRVFCNDRTIAYTTRNGKPLDIYRAEFPGEFDNVNCDNYGLILFDDPVTTIGGFFNQEELTSITIPSSVTSIEAVAFTLCKNLTSVTIPSSVTSIGSIAFSGCDNLTSITLHEGLTSIEEHAFSCQRLTCITIPASVTSIGNNLFYGCDNLVSIVVSDGNPKYDSRNNCNAIIETSTNKLISGCRNTTIPEDVTSIGESAFNWCRNLTSITIPEGVTSIEASAFSGCGSLTSITIPASVTSMGEKAFGGCNSIKDIYVNWDTPISIADNVFPDVIYSNATLHVKDDNFDLYRKTAGWSKFKSIEDKSDFCFYYTSSAKLTKYDEGQDTPCGTVVSHEFSDGKGCITFAEPVTSIGENAFFWCISLTSITIPSTVTSIGSYAFYWCENLTGITLPEGLTSIGDHAFAGSSSQTSITLPSTVTSIGDGAFYFCGSLTSITIPASVTNFGERVFSTCNNLQSVTFKGFNGEDNDLVLKCDVSVDTYSAEALTIDDSKPLQIPVDFTAESVAYSREVTAGKPCTFMLPYAVTGEQLGGTIYKLSGYEDDKVKFAQVEGETKPNVPYMIVPTGNALQGSVTNDNVQIQKTAGKAFVSGSFAGLQMVGSYSKQQLTVSPGLDFYGFYQGSFVKAGVSANLNPYRAMLQLAGTSGSAPSRLSMILDEEATSVTTLDEEMDKSTLPLYDLYGRQISAPSTRGIYINPQSGKKIRTL